MSQRLRVLTAVDFSEPGRAAFEHALALSRRHGGELTMVHAVPRNHRFRAHARERMRMIAAHRKAAAAAGVPYEASVQQGDPAGVILLHAQARRPDVIVLGSHQRTGLSRLRHGSIAETVAARAAQPVLIVPAHAPNPNAAPAAADERKELS